MTAVNPVVAELTGTSDAAASVAVSPEKDSPEKSGSGDGLAAQGSGSGDGPMLMSGSGSGSGNGSGPYTIGDRVWNDYDYDGIQDAGEPGLAGIQIDLYKQLPGGGSNPSYSFVGSRMSDANGLYSFTGGAALSGTGGDRFYVQVTVPPDMIVSPPYMTVETADSNINPTTWKSEVFGTGQKYGSNEFPYWVNNTIDVGLRLAPTVTWTTPNELIVNANNDNGSAWASASQKYVPAVRDLAVTNPTTYEDNELSEIKITVTDGSGPTSGMRCTDG